MAGIAVGPTGTYARVARAPLQFNDVTRGRSITREAEIKSVVQFADLVNVR